MLGLLPRRKKTTIAEVEFEVEAESAARSLSAVEESEEGASAGRR